LIGTGTKVTQSGVTTWQISYTTSAVATSTHCIKESFYAVGLDSTGNALAEASDKITIYDDDTGSTTELISTLAQLQALDSATTSGMYYLLTNDIDASATADWNDGAGFDSIDSFAGTFDGNGHVISNLYVNGGDYCGLFGSTTSAATIENLGLVDVDITGSDMVGGLVGENYGVVTDCFTTGTVTGCELVGGLLGDNFGSSVVYCYSSATVDGQSVDGIALGGLIGVSFSGTISNCYATGDVVNAGWCVGGFIGACWGGSIINCYSTGSVTGTSWAVGGFIGESGYSSTVITNCYTTCTSVTGSDSSASDIGAFVGDTGATITNCYYVSGITVTNSADSTLVNYSGASSTTLAALESASHAVYTATTAWDFSGSDAVWEMLGGLPILVC
jgi:hypothetical protein